MPAASCPHCGGRVMSYPRFAIQMRRGARCGACGRDVRVRAYLTAMAVGSAIAATLIVYVLIVAPDVVPMLAVMGVVGVLAVVLDYSFWRWIGFEAVPPADVAMAAAREPQREPASGP